MAAVQVRRECDLSSSSSDDDMDTAAAALPPLTLTIEESMTFSDIVKEMLPKENVDAIFKENPKLKEAYFRHTGKHDFNVSARASKRPLEDPNKFKVPPKAAKAATMLPIATIPLRNRFGTLPPEVKLSQPTPSTSNAAPAVIPTPKEPKIKPIVILKTDNYQELLKQIGKEADKGFEAKPAGQFIKIFAKTEFSHRNISKYIQDKKIEGYILEQGLIRPLKVVIRGLPSYMQAENVQNELEEIGFQVTKVAQLIKRKTQQPMPLYQVQLQNTENNKQILDLTSLNYFAVSVEYYKSPISVAQCHNCQYYHHSSTNCYLKARCVKCGENHSTKDCDKIKDPVTNKIECPKCCNCGGPHPASYRGCPKFPRTKQQIAAARQATFTGQVSANNAVRPNFSYANATTNQEPAYNNLYNSTSPQVISTNNPLFVPAKPTTSTENTIPTSQDNSLGNVTDFATVLKEFNQSIKMFNLQKLIPLLRDLTTKINATENYADKFMALMQDLPSILAVDE